MWSHLPPLLPTHLRGQGWGNVYHPLLPTHLRGQGWSNVWSHLPPLLPTHLRGQGWGNVWSRGQSIKAKQNLLSGGRRRRRDSIIGGGGGGGGGRYLDPSHAFSGTSSNLSCQIYWSGDLTSTQCSAHTNSFQMLQAS